MLLAITAWRVLIAALLPVVHDEAYYFLWGRQLDFGYLDHPPLIALVTATSRLGPASWFLARLGTLAVATAGLLVTAAFFKRLGLRGSAWLAAMVLVSFNLAGLAFGVLATPDAILLVAWVATLHEAAAALTGHPKRWISAGICLGLGLLAKYTMILMAPVLLWALWRGGRQTWRSPWPAAGALAAALVFTPHLVWNANHHWATVVFQLSHRFNQSDIGGQEGSRLPKPLAFEEDSPEAKLAAFFGSGIPEEEEEHRPTRSAFSRTTDRLGQYAVGELALWGALVFPGIALLITEIKRRQQGTHAYLQGASFHYLIPPALKPLVLASAWVPLLFFAGVSLATKVEANWPAMYVVGASAMLAGWAAEKPRWLWLAAAVNTLLLAIAVLHARFDLLPTNPAKDRLLQETHGYASLAAEVSKLEGPVLADDYQIASMLAFYHPGRLFPQWPGIERPSELTRREAFSVYDMLALEQGFWLITTEFFPPRLPGFQAIRLLEFRDCRGEPLQVVEAFRATSFEPACKKPVHVWHGARYESSSPSS